MSSVAGVDQQLASRQRHRGGANRHPDGAASRGSSAAQRPTWTLISVSMSSAHVLTGCGGCCAGFRMIDDDLGMVAPAAAEEQFPAISAPGATSTGPAPYAARLAASRAAREEAAFPALGEAHAGLGAAQADARRGCAVQVFCRRKDTPPQRSWLPPRVAP